ncbi:MAG: ATPase domain-containing protein [Spirochaetota bacterium]
MKKRDRTVFECSECGHTEAKWLGKCPACGVWNSFMEVPAGLGSGSPGSAHAGTLSDAHGRRGAAHSPVTLSEIDVDAVPQGPTGIRELDRVLGGGITPGGSVLLGGPPGIGKSTLMLQLAARTGKPTLYVTAEEPLHQVGRRARRLGASSPEGAGDPHHRLHSDPLHAGSGHGAWARRSGAKLLFRPP